MNLISETKLYETLDTFHHGNITSTIQNRNDILSLYTIDREQYDYLIHIMKSWNSDKFPLIRFVIKDLQNGNIVPMLSSDPRVLEFNGKPVKPIFLPDSIPPILKVQKNKPQSIMALFDTFGGGGYKRVKATNEIESYNCDPRKFYCYALRGFLTKSAYINRLVYDTNIKFVKTLSSLFARLFSVAISGQLGGSSRGDWMQRINYISLVYALQNFFDYPIDKARNVAFAFQSVNRAYIIENCKYYNFFNESDIKYYDMSSNAIKANFANLPQDKRPKAIDIFIGVISKEFSDMRRESMQWRTITNVFTNRYGVRSCFAIEHALSFLLMIILSDIKVNMYNDLAVNQQSEPFMDDLYDALYSITTRG